MSRVLSRWVLTTLRQNMGYLISWLLSGRCSMAYFGACGCCFSFRASFKWSSKDRGNNEGKGKEGSCVDDLVEHSIGNKVNCK